MHWIVFTPIDLNLPSAYVLHLRGWVSGLLQSGARVTLVIPEILNTQAFDHLFQHQYLKVIFYHNPFKFHFLGTLVALPILKRLLKKEDTILYSRLNFLSFFLFKIIKASLKITEHNGVFSDELQILLPQSLKWLKHLGTYVQLQDAKEADTIRVVTPQIRDYLIQKGIDQSKIIVASNGTDTELFHPKDRKKTLETFNLNPDRFYIGFIGSVTKWQAVDDVIKAFLQCMDLPIDLIIAGDGSEISSLKKQAHSIVDRVHFMGKIEVLDAPSVINCFDIALAPMRKSLYNISGSSKIKIRDYAACGRCILTGDTAEHLYLEEKGVLSTYQMDHINDLVQKIKFLYNHFEKQKEYQQKSRVYAEEHFSWVFSVKNVIKASSFSL